MSSTRPNAFLRYLLAADAVTCLVFGMSLAVFGSRLGEMMSLPGVFLTVVGWSLFPFAALLVYVAFRPEPPASLVSVIVVGNFAWTVASVLLWLSNLLAPNALGSAFILAQAGVVAVLAALEWAASRSGAPAPAR